METNTKLRKFQNGRQEKWTLEQIQAGLEHFRDSNGRYPSSREIDHFEYLPSARSIQRSLGGLESIRTELGFDPSLTNLTKGSIRSAKVKEIINNSIEHEKSFYEYLVSQVPEIRVHEQKILRPLNKRCDFFIYTTDTSGFAVDIFYTKDLFNFSRNVHIKLKNYRDVTCQVYLVVVGNTEIDQKQLDTLIANKKTSCPKHLRVLTEKHFKSNLNFFIK